MNSMIVAAIAGNKAVVDIGKYTQKGVDLSYAIKVTKFNEFTGEESEAIDHNLTVTEIEAEIELLTKRLDNVKSLQLILQDEKIPVIQDYGDEKPLEI